jgi:hypothetical protein
MPYTEDDVPYANRDTSREAAEAISEEQKRAMEVKVLKEIGASGEHGRCNFKLEEKLNMKHETCSARVNGLYEQGLVYDPGLKKIRPETGNKQIAWRLWHGPRELRPARPEPKFKRLARQVLEQLIWYSGFQGEMRPGYEATDNLILEAQRQLRGGKK